MDYLQLSFFFGLGLAVTWILVPVIIRRGASLAMARGHAFHQSHTAPIPRFGGLALAASFILVILAAYLLMYIPPDRLRDNLGMVVTSLAMFALGFVDDLRPLGARKKLAGQILIALVAALWVSTIEVVQVPWSGAKVDLGWWGIALTVLWLVAFTNLVNLVDGIDGLAGGISLMLMALLAYVGMTGGSAILPVCCAAGMAGALVAFLRFNFPPARIHLGDGGAYFLGFLVGLFSMRLSQKGTVAAALAAPLIVLALPILDVTLAILRRGLKGLPVFRADRKHLHHRILAEGFSRRDTLLMLYGFSCFCLLAAMVVFTRGGRWVPVALGAVFLLVLLGATRFKFTRNWFSIGRLLGESFQVRRESHYARALCDWFALEGARSPSLAALWQDFEFMVRKLGFAWVSLQMEDGQMIWRAPVQPPADRELRVRLDLNHPVHKTLEFTTDAERMSGRVFDQVSELAGEAWIKAVVSLGASNGKANGKKTVGPTH